MCAARPRTLLLCAVSLWLAGSTAGAQAPEGRWINLAPYPQPTQEIGSAIVNGKLYILGAYGDNAPNGLAGWFNEYDPATDRWTKKPDIPMPVHHQAMVGYNGKVYVFGGGIMPTPGGGNWYPTNRSWEFTPETNTWREIAGMPTKRGGGFAVELGGRIYVIGGRVGTMQVVSGSTTDLVEEYDTAADRWGAVKLRMPTPRDGGTVGVYQGRIYVAGGHITAAFSGGEPLNVTVHDAFEFAR